MIVPTLDCGQSQGILNSCKVRLFSEPSVLSIFFSSISTFLASSLVNQRFVDDLFSLGWACRVCFVISVPAILWCVGFPRFVEWSHPGFGSLVQIIGMLICFRFPPQCGTSHASAGIGLPGHVGAAILRSSDALLPPLLAREPAFSGNASFTGCARSRPISSQWKSYLRYGEVSARLPHITCRYWEHSGSIVSLYYRFAAVLSARAA